MFWSPFFTPSKWSKCLMLPCSNNQFISLLWVPWFWKTVCQSWYHSISSYIWIEAINPPTWRFSPWSTCCCLLKLLIFSSGSSCDCFYSYSTSAPSSSPQSTYPFSTSLSLSIFSYLLSSLLYVWSLISPLSEISSSVNIIPYSLSMATYSAYHDPRLSSSSSESYGM